MQIRFLSVALLLLVTGLSSCDSPTPDPRSTSDHTSSPASVVLVTIDTLRADRLSTYGYESPITPDTPTSPNLDRMARAGVVFENAYSTSSWTWPATASLLTGLSPEEHGVVDARTSFLNEALTMGR